jgi:poly(A) polymerase
MTTPPLMTLDAEAARHFSWTEDPPIRKIGAALERSRPGASRFVGGCVRDSLLGIRPKDIDIATTLRPEAVIDALATAGLRSAPTGIDHGTITGIADHVGVEITTLRADVTTDGRRATVAFTEDWRTDAGRRDFTINAIYLDFAQRIFDPVGGLDDARRGRVRFIGAPADRIREDYLRILRFFRFSARFARGFDAEGLAAAAAMRAGMSVLSAERVGDEFTKILSLPNAALAVDAMAATGVLGEVWPATPARDVLRRLKELAPDAAAALGLAALWGAAGEGVDRALRLSNSAGDRRKAALAAAADLDPRMTAHQVRVACYRRGRAAFADGLLLAEARAKGPDWTELKTHIERHPPPQSAPVSGKDVVALGVPAGPEVAQILKAAEAMWIEEDFPDERRLRKILSDIVDARK